MATGDAHPALANPSPGNQGGGGGGGCGHHNGGPQRRSCEGCRAEKRGCVPATPGAIYPCKRCTKKNKHCVPPLGFAAAAANADAEAEQGEEEFESDEEEQPVALGQQPAHAQQQQQQQQPQYPLDQPSILDALLAPAQPDRIVGPGHDVIMALAANGALHAGSVAHHLRGWALLSSAMHHPDLTHGLQEHLRLAVGIPPAAVAMQFADANAPRVLLQAPKPDEYINTLRGLHVDRLTLISNHFLNARVVIDNSDSVTPSYVLMYSATGDVHFAANRPFRETFMTAARMHQMMLETNLALDFLPLAWMDARYRTIFLNLYFRTLFDPLTSYHADRPIRMTDRSGQIRFRVVSMRRVTGPEGNRGVVVRFLDEGPGFSPALVHQSAHAVKHVDPSRLPRSVYTDIILKPHHSGSFSPCGGAGQYPAPAGGVVMGHALASAPVAVAAGVGGGSVGLMGMAAAPQGPMGGGFFDQKMPAPPMMMGGPPPSPHGVNVCPPPPYPAQQQAQQQQQQQQQQQWWQQGFPPNPFHAHGAATPEPDAETDSSVASSASSSVTSASSLAWADRRAMVPPPPSPDEESEQAAPAPPPIMTEALLDRPTAQSESMLSPAAQRLQQLLLLLHSNPASDVAGVIDGIFAEDGDGEPELDQELAQVWTGVQSDMAMEVEEAEAEAPHSKAQEQAQGKAGEWMGVPT